MARQDLMGCITKEELAELFDAAFAAWKPESPDPRGRRQTPRINPEGARPLFLSTYSHHGRETELRRRAKIVDVSADGFGLLLSESVPVGATLCFLFDSETGEQSQGVGEVVRVVKQADGYWIGLAFAEAARSIDVGGVPGESADRGESVPAWRQEVDRALEALSIACQVLRRGTRSRLTITRRIEDQEALFVVEAKLFRYRAALFVGDRKIATQSGRLRDRFRNLFCREALPTVVHLQGAGFSAWATLRPNEVTGCHLDPDVKLARQVCMRVLDSPAPSPMLS